MKNNLERLFQHTASLFFVAVVSLGPSACTSNNELASDESVAVSSEISGPVVTDTQMSGTNQGSDSSAPTSKPMEGAIEALDDLVQSIGSERLSDVFENSCGTFAVTFDPGYVDIQKWNGESWSSLPRVEPPTFIRREELQSSGGSDELRKVAVWDVTGDNEVDVVFDLRFGNGSTYTLVLTPDENSCKWFYPSVFDACGWGFGLTNARAGGDQLVAEGELRCDGSPEVKVVYTWFKEINSFIGAPMNSEPYCGFVENDLSFFIKMCDSGRVVQLVQEALVRSGIEVKIDGQFGIETQAGVIAYQQRMDLEVIGHVEIETWASMYPAGGPDRSDFAKFPDYDGDGISSPSEISQPVGD